MMTANSNDIAAVGVKRKVRRTLSPVLERFDSTNSSDSHIAEGGIPGKTSHWSGEELPYLRVKVDTIKEDPFDIFQTSYVDFLRNETGTLSKIINLFRQDDNLDVKRSYQRLCRDVISFDCNRLNDVSFQEVFNLKTHLKSPNWTNDHRLPVNCGIKVSLKRFYTQLLYMKGMKFEELSDGMFQELFMGFLRIFGLEVNGFTNIPVFTFDIGDLNVKSTPDALICNSDYRNLEKKQVIAVIEVTKEYSRNGADAPTTCRADKVTRQVPHINSKLKAQHVGEMLSVLHCSVFNVDGIYGFIVQGTNVTVVSFKPDEDYVKSLEDGTLQTKEAVVQYSRECNLLSRDGRMALCDVLFDMAKLLEFLCEERSK